jgi:DNA-binding GntR family transcriptional regulator
VRPPIALDAEASVTQEPAYARVCQQLRQDILAGVFPWGERLKAVQLAHRYGVSQMPIREALQCLRGEGLVTIEPNCGARVRKIDEKFVRDVYELRHAIAMMLIRRAIHRMTDARLQAMEIIVDTHEQALHRGELDACIEYNKQFHRVICRAADHSDGTEILERYWELIDALRRQYGFGLSFMSAIVAGHRRLLDAFRNRDVEAAVRCSDENSEQSCNDLIHRMRVSKGGIP